MLGQLQVKRAFLLLSFIILSVAVKANTSADQIIGTWMSAEKNLVVQVYKDGDNSFKARIVWFSDGDDKNRPMETRLDDKNPDKSLRSRKILGMNVLRNLNYIAKTNSWEEGMIYDAKNGREWNSAAIIDKDGTLKVTGYWHFKFIGKTLKFDRITQSDRLLTSR